MKWDGYRFIIAKDGSKVTIRTRNGLDWTAKLPHLADRVASLPVTQLVIDGELVALDGSGQSDFQLLQRAFKQNSAADTLFYAFDLLAATGEDLRSEPLVDRKKALAHLLRGKGRRAANRDVIQLSDHIVGEGKTFFEACCSRGLEGIISKRADAPYEAGRTRTWLKVKCDRRQEFVVAGYTKPEGKRQGFGALLLGFYEGKSLVYCGRVGTGFDDALLLDLIKELKKRERATPAFDVKPAAAERKGVHWTEPTLTAEVRFAGWTADKRLRHAAFLGMRPDKEADAVTLEKPAKTPGNVQLTHPERVLFPDQGITKRDLASYFEAVAPHLLPHIVHRPLSLLRCPRGGEAKCFFQKHFQGDMPAELRAIAIEETTASGDYILVDDVDGLTRLVQLGVLELHPWGSREDDLEHPDTLVFDLDPGPGIKMADLARAAKTVRAHLGDLGLESFLKTSGGKGLHIFVPLMPDLTWNGMRELAKAVSTRVAQDEPQTYVTKMTRSLREGRIFLDYFRNNRGATSVAPYSPRARAGAPVSTPLAWSELSARLDPAKFTVSSVPERLAGKGADPWRDYFKIRQRVDPKLRAALEAP